MQKDLEKLRKEKDHHQMHVIVDGRYRHYRNPQHLYRVLAMGILESTEEVCVVYQAEYGDCLIWVRPVKEWCEMIGDQGMMVQRFTHVP